MAQHTKKLSAPNKWRIKRKTNTWVTSPAPGAHDKKGMPLLLVLRNVIKAVNSKKEARVALNRREILVDGKEGARYNTTVGLMDVISLPKEKKHYRITLGDKGKYDVIQVKKKESNKKVCGVTHKSLIKKGKTQITLHDGKTLITKKKVSVGDSVLLKLPDNKVKKTIKNKRGARVLVTGGSHTGETAKIQGYKEYKGVQPDKVELKNDEGKEYDTLKNYALVVGEKKAEVTIK